MCWSRWSDSSRAKGILDNARTRFVSRFKSHRGHQIFLSRSSRNSLNLSNCLLKRLVLVVCVAHATYAHCIQLPKHSDPLSLSLSLNKKEFPFQTSRTAIHSTLLTKISHREPLDHYKHVATGPELAWQHLAKCKWVDLKHVFHVNRWLTGSYWGSVVGCRTTLPRMTLIDNEVFWNLICVIA